eukprot:GHVN01086302.1.p1 GENE.GHVN01086302.1~~GHVN01086302.1.p1  ORF type:complete len:149 (+),score=38.75 GHVN01086302.1:256-702(+)
MDPYLISLYAISLTSILISPIDLWVAVSDVCSPHFIFYSKMMLRPILGVLLCVCVCVVGWVWWNTGECPWSFTPPIILTCIALIVSIKLRVETMARTATLTDTATWPLTLPLRDDEKIVLIDYAGRLIGYPLQNSTLLQSSALVREVT